MMSANDSAPLERYVPQSLADLKAAARGSRHWLWHGYLAAGNLTLLTSLWKAGKSTLISVLLARMKTGGTIAGLPVAAGRAVVVSEEPPEKWVERSRLVDLDGHVDWFCLPFTGTPTEDAWLELLGRIARLHEHRPITLLVIDSLSNLSPMRSENDAVQMLRPLQPLRRLTERGVSGLIAHHPKKGATLPGQAARGSGALSGFVDIIVEMHALSRRPDDRRRLLRSFSRHSATPPSLVIEWTPDGADYRSLGTSAELDYEHGWPLLHAILDQSEGPLTRREILRRWPDSTVSPSGLTLWKWLGRAVQEGRVLQNGRGHRRDPFRYQLPGMIEKWQQKLLATFFKRLEPDEKDKGPERLEAPLSPDDDAPPAAPLVRPEEEPLEPVPLLESGPETPPTGSPSPVPVPSVASARPTATPAATRGGRALAVPVEYHESRRGSRGGVAAGTGSDAEWVSMRARVRGVMEDRFFDWDMKGGDVAVHEPISLARRSGSFLVVIPNHNDSPSTPCSTFRRPPVGLRSMWASPWESGEAV
jgi:hypothetical protein